METTVGKAYAVCSLMAKLSPASCRDCHSGCAEVLPVVVQKKHVDTVKP